MVAAVIYKMFQCRLYVMKRASFVLSISVFVLLFYIWVNTNPEKIFQPWNTLLGKYPLSREAGERCQVANLDLNQSAFLRILNEDNRIRSYSPKCLPQSFRLFDFDYNSKLVRIKQEKNNFWENMTCCYIPFQRKNNSDTELVISPTCHNIISDETSLPPDHEFINIECKRNNTLVYSDLLGYVPIKADVEKRISDYEKTGNPSESDHKRVNVVILGLDAVSKYNLLRYLPETHNYVVNNLSGIQFSKYHRVDGYSFDNMGCGFHMGLTRKEVVDLCWPDKNAFLDTCPIIWKQFAAKGFRTSYAEDAVPWSIFWYDGDCKGFVRQPTDYDYRTLTRRMEYFSGYRGEPTHKVCYGDKFDHQVIIDNIVRTAVALENKLYFQFNWMCALTHNTPIMTTHIGDSIIKMFEDLKKRNLMNNTVFIFLADHGMNFGAPAKTIQGTIEANLPFFYMILPKWFSRKYPKAMKNLKRNSQLLTSHFDSHETLKDFLDLSTITDEALAKREQDQSYLNKRGISFFLPIPKSRDCQSAGLMLQFCSCWTLQNVSADHYLIQESKETLVTHFKNVFGDQYEKCKNVISFGPVENSNCTIPNSDELAKRINQTDYSTLGVEPQCDFQVKLLSSQTTVSASMKKSKGTWTILKIKFSTEPEKDNSCSQLSSDPNVFCNCILFHDIAV